MARRLGNLGAGRGLTIGGTGARPAWEAGESEKRGCLPPLPDRLPEATTIAALVART